MYVSTRSRAGGRPDSRLVAEVHREQWVVCVFGFLFGEEHQPGVGEAPVVVV